MGECHDAQVFRHRALITGATAGIGAAYTRLLAREHFDLVLVARNVARLEQLAEDLRRDFGVEVEVLAADLADRSQLALVEARLRDAERPIDVLVNNAGFGLNQRFATGDLEREQSLVDVLVTAVMRLTHAAAGAMKQRGRGDIILVSSVAGYIAGGSYSAVKAWATVLAESLNQELRGTGVRVSALCPGFTRTEFHERAGISMQGLPRFLWLDADRLVAAGWRDHQRGRVVSVPGWQYRTLIGLTQVAPRSLVRKVGFSARNRTRK